MQALRAGHEALDRSREIVLAALDDGRAHYGINTGFGVLANKRIDNARLTELQQNLLLSHACGVGEPVPPEITRLMLRLKIHALGLGQSGISRSTFEQLLTFDRIGTDALGAQPGQRRRFGRPGAAGAPLPAPDRPRRSLERDGKRQEGRRRGHAVARHRAGAAEGERRPGADQRDPVDDGLRRFRAGAGAGPAEGSRHPGGHEPGSPARQPRALRRTHSPGPAAPRTAQRGRQRAQAARAQRDHGCPPRLRQGAGSLLPALRAAGARGQPRRAGLRRRHGRDRAQLRHRQSTGFRQWRHHLGRQLPRPAAGAGAGLRRHGAGRTGQHLGAPHLPAAGGPRRAAQTADGGHRPQFRVHDPAVHGGGPGVGKQGAVPSGQRRLHSHQPRAGGPREHGLDQRHQAARRAAQRRARAGRRVPDRGAGAGLPRAAQARPRRPGRPPPAARADQPCQPGLRSAQRSRTCAGLLRRGDLARGVEAEIGPLA
jgi:hypothetical protein